MKSNTFNRLAVAVMIGAVALTGVSTPAMAQGGGKAQREAKAEKVQRTGVAPKSVKVDRGANRVERARVPAAEPVPIRRAQPKPINDRQVDRTARPATREPKRNVRVVENNGPAVVQRADKPVKVRKPAPVISTDDSVVVRNPRNPRNVNPVVRPSDPVRPVKVQPNNRDNRDYRAARVSDQIQRNRIAENRSRISNYNQVLIRQQRIADQRRRELELQRRLAQARYMQDYWRRLAIQQQRVNSWQSYNYNNDPYFYTPASYRYGYGGNYYETNQYGRNLLEQAVNEGYREGYYAGRADRDDRWRYGYQDSFAYQDANCGYNGMYVSQSNYNYYFRQGFERGYEDGYYSRSNYGHHTGTTIAILAGVLGTILVLDAIND